MRRNPRSNRRGEVGERWTQGRRVTLAVLASLGLAACSDSRASVGGETNGEEVATVERGDLEIRVEASGAVEPILVVEVKSKASGEITALQVETGDRVERGALLATVDPRDVRNTFAQAEADLEVARARLQISESQQARADELRKANVVTQQELEQSVLDAANARAQLIKARVNLDLAREKMGDVTIRAPIAGTVIQKTVEAGQIIASASGNVSGGTTLMLMADLSMMQVRTLVDETDIGKVASGQVAQVQVEAHPGRTFTGSVYKIEPQAVVEQNVTMFPVLVRLDNREGLLKPNMNAEVAIEVANRSDVLLVPNAAVVGMQDAAAAAAIFGMDAETMRERMQSTRPEPQRAGGAAADGGADSAATGGADGATDCGTLLARVRGGDRGSLSEAERARVRECVQQSGGRGGRFAGARSADPDTRAAVLFVHGATGPEPRLVMLGLNDWDRTEVVSGVEEGERVVMMSVARLRQQQEELMNRIRERSSPIPGGGGSRGR
ncbi:MAG TPA: efflux RND transporter periplasmic adaptor subunit [Longimicrobiales bacterium]|nr:efflux RND transporter periplasmic adaptor subunit [Longimicrobiales bacterium]